MKERMQGMNIQQSEAQASPNGMANAEMQPNQPLTLADIVEQAKGSQGGRILNSRNSEGIILPEVHQTLLDKGGSLLLDLNGNVTRQNPIKIEGQNA